MELTVADLIAQLEELPEDATIRLATQPSYPLAAMIRSEPAYDEETNTVWLAEASLPRDENPYDVFPDAFN